MSTNINIEPNTVIEKTYLIGKNGSVVLEGDSSPYISNSIKRYRARLKFSTPLVVEEGKTLTYAIAFQNKKGIYTYLAEKEEDKGEYYCFVPNGALVPGSHFQIGLIALDGNIKYEQKKDDNGTLIEIPTGKIEYKYSTLWSLPQAVLEGAFEGSLKDCHEAGTILEGYIYLEERLEEGLSSTNQRITNLESDYSSYIAANDLALTEIDTEINNIQEDIKNLKNKEVTSWEKVQQIVRDGLADKVFEIGDQFVCNHKDYGELVWDVIGFDQDAPVTPEGEIGNYNHSMTLQLHNCLTGEVGTKEHQNKEFDYDGSNNWKTSNIRQWLNSDGEAKKWFNPHEDANNDTAPTYADIDGFLRGLDSDFKEVLGTVLKQTRYDGYEESLETTFDKIFLLSRIEVNDTDGEIIEGRAYAYYIQNQVPESRIKTRTTGDIKYYFLRSPVEDTFNQTYVIGEGGIPKNSYSNSSKRGLSPACCIV